MSLKIQVQEYIGEFLATFFFLFTVQGAAYSSQDSVAPVIFGAVATGFAGVAVVASFASIGGAHFNPSVTIAAMIRQKISILKGFLYIILQVLAGLLATVALSGLYPGSLVSNAKQTVVRVPSSSSLINAVIMESLMTFILTFVVYAVALGLPSDEERHAGKHGGIVSLDSDEPPSEEKVKQKNSHAALAIGFTLGFLVFIGGQVSGGAFNPARATGPAIVGLDFADLWVYWVGGIVGPLVSSAFWLLLFL